jgi:hypothetical protein
VSTPTWKGTFTELQPLVDLFQGVYGDPPFYYVEPTAQQNVLPPHWATPSLSVGAGPKSSPWPSLVLNTTVAPYQFGSTLGAAFPPFTGHYDFLTTPVPTLALGAPRATVPIPPGYTAALKVWGTVSGTARVAVTAYNRATQAPTTTLLTPISGGVSVSLAGNTYSHFDVFLTKTTDGDTSAINLNAMVCSVTTIGTVPTTWYAGEGVSGMDLDGALQREAYHLQGKGWSTLSGTLVEVGSWLHGQ